MLAILFMNVFAPLIDYYVLQANINRRAKRIKATMETETPAPATAEVQA